MISHPKVPMFKKLDYLLPINALFELTFWFFCAVIKLDSIEVL